MIYIYTICYMYDMILIFISRLSYHIQFFQTFINFPRRPGQGVLGLGSTRTSRISWIALVEKKKRSTKIIKDMAVF